MGHSSCCCREAETTGELGGGRNEVFPASSSTLGRTPPGQTPVKMITSFESNGLSEADLEMMSRNGYDALKIDNLAAAGSRVEATSQHGSNELCGDGCDQGKASDADPELPSKLEQPATPSEKPSTRRGEEGQSEIIEGGQRHLVGFKEKRQSDVVEVEQVNLYSHKDATIEAQIREINQRKLAATSPKKANSGTSLCRENDGLSHAASSSRSMFPRCAPPTYEFNYDLAENIREGFAWKLNSKILNTNGTELSDIQSWRQRAFGIKRDSHGRVDLAYISEAENAIWVTIAFLMAEKGAPIAEIEALPVVSMIPCANEMEVSRRVFDYDYVVLQGARYKNLEEYKAKIPSSMYPISIISKIYDDDGAIKSRFVTLGWNSEKERKLWLACLRASMDSIGTSSMNLNDRKIASQASDDHGEVTIN